MDGRKYNMDIGLVVYIIFGWSIIGVVLLGISGIIDNTKDLEFLDPVWLYDRYDKLNYLGIFFVFLGYNLISPIMSVCYWIAKILMATKIYKIFTIGRKR